jgi:hypothetical protein
MNNWAVLFFFRNGIVALQALRFTTDVRHLAIDAHHATHGGKITENTQKRIKNAYAYPKTRKADFFEKN